ncbi:hypothetical protein BRCON_2090 [Candidatus Sumerlaea chitinivorans]|uniref:Uncharacterized protein n=1 Tax=Sumerlaea chitinivorans TaxID=2250252 RepID=A0A2Z4Y6L2_SUMC1|nr:hypothetical protein BRCON_2090 [Candidatus Sumerlaea chitinivorans]
MPTWLLVRRVDNQAIYGRLSHWFPSAPSFLTSRKAATRPITHFIHAKVWALSRWLLRGRDARPFSAGRMCTCPFSLLRTGSGAFVVLVDGLWSTLAMLGRYLRRRMQFRHPPEIC